MTYVAAVLAFAFGTILFFLLGVDWITTNPAKTTDFALAAYGLGLLLTCVGPAYSRYRSQP